MMRIALLQDHAEPLNTAANLERLRAAAHEARSLGAELLITPELFVHGYAPARLRAEVTEEDATASLARLQELAAEAGIALVASLPGPGAPETRGITAVLLDAAGQLLARHTKTHLFGAEERDSFTAGDESPPVIELGGLRIGLLICYEVEFPETARALALAGAELIAVPTALAGDFNGVTELIVPARALENQVHVAYANHLGASEGLRFPGRSLVAGPEGTVIASAGESPDLIVADVAPAESPDPDYLADRRPELYRDWADEAG